MKKNKYNKIIEQHIPEQCQAGEGICGTKNSISRNSAQRIYESEAIRNFSEGEGTEKGYAELKTAYPETVPREFMSAKRSEISLREKVLRRDMRN